MKKLLSVILALAMLISLVPAAVAVDTTETEMEYSGVTVKYDTDKSSLVANDIVSSISYAQTNNFWKFYSASLSLDNGSKVSSMRLLIETKVNDWTAFEIYVPKSGKYDITIDHGKMKKSTYATDNANMWILPLIDPDTGKEYEIEKITEVLDNSAYSPINSEPIDFYDDTATNNSTVDGVSVGAYSFPSEGEYLVIYKAMTAGVYNSNTRLAYINPKDITLDGDGADAENIIPMTLPVSVDKTEISVGSEDNSTAQMTATAYMSDGTAVADAYTVTYASSDSNIATVDESGLVTAKGYGTATITATAVINGYTVSGSKTINVDNPNGVKITYDAASLAIANTHNGFLTYLTKNNTNGFYRYYGMATTSDTDPGISDNSTDLGQMEDWIRLNGASAVAFEIYVPKSDYYTMEMETALAKRGCMAGVFLGKANEIVLDYNNSSKPGKLVGQYECCTGADTNVSVSGIWIDEGWNTISFTEISTEKTYDGHLIYIGDFTLTSGSGILPMPAIVKVDKTTLTLNDTDNTAAIMGAVQCNTEGTVTAESSDTTVYESSDTSVVTVNGTTITAVGTGTAEITATIGEGDAAVTATRTITVVDKTAAEEVETVQFMATSTLADNAGVTTNISGYTVGETTDAIEVGKTVKVTADDVEGYIFRGWKRGSRDNGVWVSEDKTYSFPLLTNTYLTAIYDVDTATDAAVNVEFYNFNGQFLASKAVNGAGFATLASGIVPTLTGYNSFFWTVDGESEIASGTVFNKLTRVVAKFTDTDSFAVTVPENVTSDKTSGTYAYDTEIEMSAENAGFWKVNGKTVAYGTSYTYCVWSAATIAFEEATNDNKPIISIDGNSTDGAKMISYDANGASIVEAGILFGEKATINSADSRAVSREARGNVSGQFTARPYNGDATYACGYLIYNDNGTYRVIYAD